MCVIERTKRGRIKVGIAVFLMCAGIWCFSVFAEGPSTNVWIDVIEVETETRISVTVPASYGFVVKGSMAAADDNPVSVADGNLLLSNVRVTVTSPSAVWQGAGSQAGDSVYQLETIGQGAAVPLRNYSTVVNGGDTEQGDLIRVGLPVSVRPYLIEEADSKYWRASGTAPTTNATDFKKYQMILGDLPLSEAALLQIGDETVGAFRTVSGFDLAAPPEVPAYGYTAAGTAIVPSETYLSVDVKVGGVQNQYKQVETSAKVGTICWEIIPGNVSD